MFAALIAYKNAAIGLALAAVLAFAGAQTVRLHVRDSELIAANAVADGLRASIQAQNTGIAAVQAATASVAVQSTKANAVAKTVTATAEAKAVAIEASPAAIDCNAAIAELAQGLSQ